MKITSIHLESFRKFVSLKMDLHEDFNVIIGANGSGKTTVLEALTVALGSLLIAIPGAQSQTIATDDARAVHRRDHDLWTSEVHYPIFVRAGGIWNETRHQWTRGLSGAEHNTTHGEASEIKDYAASLVRALRLGMQVDLPLIAYYDAKGMRTTRREAKLKDKLDSRLIGYKDCLAGEANLKELRRFMMEQEFAAFQGNPRVPHLDAIDRAVTDCISAGREAESFRYDVQLKDLVVTWRTGRKESLERLSAGYQRVISIVADLAWRACTLNPAWGAEAPANIEGVVLIDELDMHLHPAWQHRVIDDLRRTFPKLQWITTTHSPTLLTHTRREWLRVLSAEETQEVREFARGVRGREIGDLLLHVMGASLREDETIQELHQLAQAIEAGEMELATTLLAGLRSRLGEEDRDIMRLSWELDWKREEA